MPYKMNLSRIQREVFSGVFLSLLLLTPGAKVLAEAGHGGSEFQGGSNASQMTEPIPIDTSIAAQLGIKVEPVIQQRLATGIKATGQIETLPNRRVDVTTPVGGTVIKLLVNPGEQVKVGQAVAIMTSPDLAELRTNALDRQAEAIASVQQAQADLRLAQQNYEQQQKIAATDIQQAQTALNFAQERYDRDKELLDRRAIPRRQVWESETQLAVAKAALAKAQSRLQVSEAQAQLKRAQSGLGVARSRLALSNQTYQTRLRQLRATPNADGTITVKAPISGVVANREATIGESGQDAGKRIMTIVDGSGVFATANIYEKDSNQIRVGQPVRIKIDSLPNRTFRGRVAVIGSAIEGENRIVPVRTELDNPGGVLKPGMFAQLEILTDRTPTAVLAAPSAAIVEAGGKDVVYVQKGKTYQPTEVTQGRTSDNLVEIKTGISASDRIVTQGAPLLYAQSLKGGGKEEGDSHGEEAGSSSQNEGTKASSSSSALPWWIVLPLGGASLAGAFWVGSFWTKRRMHSSPLLQVNSSGYETEVYLDDSKLNAQFPPEHKAEKPEESRNPHQ
ncbi:efflux RND transporter periplasmic adaptor subunit [Chroococcidiopsis sp. FACHB-1243]|uniref:efflux RND transporter periplasmic adaptor subunit n=1 Tax=Chroococcidiopsis sp. [FACHB-1243] TaxID=2692781 RepID=UPI001781A2B3|nr:efflux RND transporter periplasmic adaptor subunit [Chroococcidiopsis sp. [FACHB-1243]]MBD2309341.1 efflux RND transporter periplasmic adaptor subunit [Chroococcidiopsis sp. [FACHB-1243]]